VKKVNINWAAHHFFHHFKKSVLTYSASYICANCKKPRSGTLDEIDSRLVSHLAAAYLNLHNSTKPEKRDIVKPGYFCEPCYYIVVEREP
jgi:hypothetical protein